TSFLSYQHYAICHLNSFPTRRSSDLGQKEDLTVMQHSIDLGGRLGYRGSSGVRTGLYARIGYHLDALQMDRCARKGRFERPTSRSEEHTSELQSRSDLVCRLLLEKKK